MSKLPARFVLKIKPKEYLKQGISHCGAYSVKGILSAFGKDKTFHPKEYHTNWFTRVTGITLNRSYWPRVFESYGIKAIPKNAGNVPKSKRLDVLKRIISTGNPVMLSIGNGYVKNGKYSWFMGRIVVQHWVTLWGYDDNKNIFCIYDSAVPKDEYTKEISVGNITRTYDQVLRDWQGAFISQVTRGIKPYHYIDVSG